MNAPNRHELVHLADNERKVEWDVDTRTPNTSVFIFNKEDHTLGNLLATQLNRHPEVIYAGYRMDHPLRPRFILRIQTNGTITPRRALQQICAECIKTLELLHNDFIKEMELKRASGQVRTGVAKIQPVPMAGHEGADADEDDEME